MLIEVPCGNIESVYAAEKGGADRIELCSSLSVGGLTPSVGMFEESQNVALPKFVMIRPREGDFIYSSEEFRIMIRDVEFFKRAGAEGIVTGILMKNGEIDSQRTSELIQAAHPLPLTFHRAFDLTPDPFRSLELLIKLKTGRILTSGQASDAYKGRELISKLVNLSGDEIIILPGAGINAGNVSEICKTGVKEIHLSGKTPKRSEMIPKSVKVKMGKEDDESSYDVTDPAIIKKVREIVGE